MKELPQKFVERMTEQLGEEATAFFASFDSPSPTSIRLHHQKGRSDFQHMQQVPWCSDGYYLEKRPWFHLDPHWHGGAYYVQEASSMILDYIIKQLPLDNRSRIWLDMCAAPGGKAGILARYMRSSDVLIANEVVPQRRAVLRENLYKGGYLNTFIGGERASAFREPVADIILIDAPCAGEGMMRKDEEAIRQWSPALVQECALMQQNILEDIITSLKPGGFLIFSTCSYSNEENIHQVSAFANSHALTPVVFPFPEDWKIMPILSDGITGYQLFPHRVKGEGLFIAVLHKAEKITESPRAKKPINYFSRPPNAFLENVKDADQYLVLQKSTRHAFISDEAEENAREIMRMFPRMELLAEAGEVKGKDFIPAHFLPMAHLAHERYAIVQLTLEQGLDYLERSTMLPMVTETGWYQVAYHETLLGWAKFTSNGWKNHYPQTWKLRSRKMS